MLTAVLHSSSAFENMFLCTFVWENSQFPITLVLKICLKDNLRFATAKGSNTAVNRKSYNTIK